MNSLGGNMTTVKLQNRALILNVLKNKGAVSRLDISYMVNLTPAAITIIVNEMLKEGIVREVGQLEEYNKRSGRKKMLIDVNYDLKYVIGINIESDIINIGISNLKGDIKTSKRITTDKELKPEDLLENIASECMKILWSENILKENILGAGVGIIGPVDKVNGISLKAYGLWKDKVPVKKILEKEMGIKVTIDNNVRNLALGEMDYHVNDEIKSMLFVKYGPGIGSALILDNEIYVGSRDEAGEIGHTIVESKGEVCRCGKRGCLETIASKSSILNKVKSIYGKEKTPKLFILTEGNLDKVNLECINQAILEGDIETKKILDTAIYYLALSIGNTINIIDPFNVVLYGDVFKSEYVMKRFIEYLKELSCLDNPEETVYQSALNKRSNYIGAIALALREFFYNVGGM